MAQPSLVPRQKGSPIEMAMARLDVKLRRPVQAPKVRRAMLESNRRLRGV